MICARLACALGVMLGALALADGAAAQDWSVESSISQSATYNSNLLLRPNHEISTFGSLTQPRLRLSREGPDSNFVLSSQFKFLEYPEHSDLNADAELIHLGAGKALSERSTLNLSGDFNRDTTLTSEEDITDKFLSKRVRFTQWDVSPSWGYALTPLDQITLTGNYLQKRYDGIQKTDYNYYGAQVDYEHKLTELASATASLSYFHYDAFDVLDTGTDIYGGLVGYNYRPSETFFISGAVGLDYDVTKRDDRNGGGRDSQGDVGYRLKFETDYQASEQTKIKFLLSHDTEPSGDGRTENRTRGTLSLTYALTTVTDLGLDANYVDNHDYLGTSDTSRSGNQTRYYALKPSLTWNITEDLSLSASYQFRYKTFESQGTAIDNGALLTVRYGFPDFHWSGF